MFLLLWRKLQFYYRLLPISHHSFIMLVVSDCDSAVRGTVNTTVHLIPHFYYLPRAYEWTNTRTNHAPLQL